MVLRKRRGALITFSGVDCSGKSTQLEIVDARLRARGIAVTRVWNRVGYTRWFQGIKDGVRALRPNALPAKATSYGRHKELGNPRTRAAWFAFATADLARLYSFTVARRLRAGHVVLCDRYLADSHVDLRLHFPEADLPRSPLWRSLIRIAPKPDLALFFDVPLEVALARANEKREVYRQPDEMVAKRIAAYREANAQQPPTIIDGTRPKADIADALMAMIEPMLGSELKRSTSSTAEIR